MAGSMPEELADPGAAGAGRAEAGGPGHRPPGPSAAHRQAALLPILSRLQDAGLRGVGLNHLLRELSEDLRQAGLPLGRSHLSVSTLHPLFRAIGTTWYRRSGAADLEAYDANAQNGQAWQDSPFSFMLENAVHRLRRRLRGPQAVTDYRLLADLARRGFSDWYGSLYGFGWSADPAIMTTSEMGAVFSWAADNEEGFSAADLAMLETVGKALALSVKAVILAEMAQGLLGTYLGRDAAAHVIEGAVSRGSMEELEAVVMYADLRGFTALSEALPAQQVVEILNLYFDAMGEPVEWHGGQILKFLGDGFIATFALDDADPAAVCRKALSAALVAQKRVAGLNQDRTATGLPVMELDMVLHAGRLQYGNVGTQQRLDFTVIGPVVNQAARLEQACKALGHSLVATSAFRSAHGGEGEAPFLSLGRTVLRGIAEPQEVFAVRAQSR